MALVPGFLSWIYDIPLVSRIYLFATLAITSACFLDFVSPLTLYFNWDLACKGQYWRFFTSFFFFGNFSLDFVFHMYFVMRYCRLLEEGWFRGRTADFILLLTFGAVSMILTASLFPFFSRIKFLGHSLTFMMVYLWSRDPDNAHVQMSFLGIMQFKAPYLPWILMGFSLLIGTPVEMDLLGIIIGHVFYFCDQIYPHIAQYRKWRLGRILVTPTIISNLFVRNEGLYIIDSNVRFSI